MTKNMPAQEKIVMAGNVSLLVRDGGVRSGMYPSCRIQKGLLLACGQKDLSGEGVGFGVPILRLMRKAVFPGSARITNEIRDNKTFVNVDYDLNLMEKMTVKGRNIDNRTFYTIKEYLSGLHREYPVLRKIFTHASNILRRTFGIETRFEKVSSFGIVHVLYIIHSGNIHVSVDTGKVKKYGCTDIMLMNEQSAGCFSIYRDSYGAYLKGNAIGTWDETFADEASFIDPLHDVVFTMHRVAGSRMFRGREFVRGRLAWSGLAYMIPPIADNFNYDIRIRCK